MKLRSSQLPFYERMKLTDGEVSNMEETLGEFSIITETHEVVDLIKFMFPC